MQLQRSKIIEDFVKIVLGQSPLPNLPDPFLHWCTWVGRDCGGEHLPDIIRTIIVVVTVAITIARCTVTVRVIEMRHLPSGHPVFLPPLHGDELVSPGRVIHLRELHGLAEVAAQLTHALSLRRGRRRRLGDRRREGARRRGV